MKRRPPKVPQVVIACMARVDGAADDAARVFRELKRAIKHSDRLYTVAREQH